MRRYWLIIALLAALPAKGSLPEGYDQIVVSRHANEGVAEAAKHLASLLERSYGRSPQIRRSTLTGGPRGIHIGPRPDHPAFDRDPLTDQIIVERSRRGLEITGQDNTSTCFAVYRFAEAFLGWRYFQPGEMGLERLDTPPAIPSIDGIHEDLLKEEAGFFSRNPQIRGTGSSGPDWRKWHGIRERFAYNHTLHRVLPPSRFEKNPEWFAKDAAGNPVPQPYDEPHGYNNHPDLTQQGLRHWVVGQTGKALEQYEEKGTSLMRSTPGMASISISLGDSFVFGNFPPDYPFAPKQFFRRWPDYGNHVFDYSNEVAQSIAEDWEARHPERRLFIGALSYLNWENVPDFDVHSSIVPYITFDRSQWHDPRARADDLELVSRWRTKGPEFLGTWDYIFGYGFLIPRNLASIISESIPALYERGVRAYFSQVLPVWPYDALTTWLTTRLLWNPGADAASMVDEFYREFYGPGADSMRAFFERAEQIWMKQEGQGWWLRYWKDPWQAAIWSADDVATLEMHLETALQKVRAVGEKKESGLDAQRFETRIRQTTDLFEMTRAFLRYESLSWELQSGTWESASQKAIQAGLVLCKETLSARKALKEISEKLRSRHPNTATAHDLSWVFRYDGDGAAIATILQRASRLDWLPAGAMDSGLTILDEWLSLNNLEGRPDFTQANQVLHDTDFSDIEDSSPWRRQFMSSEGMHVGQSREGIGFTVQNVRRGHITQSFDVEPGHYYLAHLDVDSAQTPSGEVYIRLDFFKDGELMAQSPRARLLPVKPFGTEQRLRALMAAPEGATKGRLMIRFYEMDQGSQADLIQTRVYDLGRVPSP
jgi:hypothetical protein